MKLTVLSRVAYPLHGYGGLERSVGYLVLHLVRQGVDVTLYTTLPDNYDASLEGVRIETVPYRHVPWPRAAGFVVLDRNTNYLLWSLRAAKRALAHPTDIVEVEAGAGFGYAFLRSVDSAPFVLQSHGMEEFKTGWMKRTAYLPLRLATRFAAQRAAKVIVPDHAMEKEVHRYLGVTPERTIVLPLAVDLEEIDEPIPNELQKDLLERLDLTEELFVVLSVGRIESNKGFPVLARALARVKDKISGPWRWVIVGRGPQESRLKETVQELGINDETCFAGNLSDQDLAALYKRARLFVHPTLYEGSSIVTLEAMAHGLPVVATTVGGIPDKVVEGESGFLVPPGDDEALADALLRAFSLGGGLVRFGEEGRRRVENEFNWADRARRLLELYREIVSAAK